MRAARWSARARACSLRARALLALLAREAGPSGLLYLAACAPSPCGVAGALARLLGASAADRRGLPAIVAELFDAGAIRLDGGALVVCPADGSRAARVQLANATDDTTTRNESDPVYQNGPRKVHQSTRGTPRAARVQLANATDDTTTRNESDPVYQNGPRKVQLAEASETPSARVQLANATDDPTTRNDRVDAVRYPAGTPLALSEESSKKNEGITSFGNASAGDAGGPGQGATMGLTWVAEPREVSRRLNELSGGKISISVLGRDEPFRALLADLAAERPRLGEELECWARLVASALDRFWTHGDRIRPRLLGRVGEDGKLPAAGLRRCLDEAAAQLASDEAAAAARERAARDAAARRPAPPLAVGAPSLEAARAAREGIRAALQRADRAHEGEGK